MSKYITAKEIASDLELDERTIRLKSKQRQLGIDAAIDRTCGKPIRFYKDKVRVILAKLGHVAGF